MVVSATIFETRGGATLDEVEPSKITWSWNGVDPETVTLTFDMQDAANATRSWRALGSPWNHCVALDIGGRQIGGPIMPQTFEDDSRTLQIAARGLRVALARRHILPVTALTESLVDSNGIPKLSMDSAWGNWDYGTIGKRIVQQAMTFPSWTDVPMTYEDDRRGSRVSSYSAVDLKDVDSALSDLSNLENGPDIRIELQRLSADQFGWRYRSGTETQPRLQSEAVFTWNIGGTSGLRVETDPTRMASLAWSVGGRSQDKTIIAGTYDPTLIDNGGLLLETKTGASSSTSEEDTLIAWNLEALRTGRRPWEFWSFRVPTDQSPYPFEYAPGDLVKVVVSDDAPIAGGYIAKGEYTRRIAELSGNEDGRFVTITCGEVYDNG